MAAMTRPSPSRPAPNVYWPAAAALGLLACFFSPEFIRRWFVADHHQLGAFVVERIAAIRIALGAAAAACAAAACVPASRRNEALSRASRRLYGWADRPAASYWALLLGFLFLRTELRVFEWEPMSEGLCTFGAVRLLQGELPCRDFFTYVPPGWFFAMAAVFKLFGTTLNAARLWMGVVPKLLITVILYRTSRHMLERPAALAVASATLLILSPNPLAGEIHPAPLALLVAACTLPLLLSALRTGRRSGFVLAGVAAALCALVRQDFGLYVLLANASGLLLACPPKTRARALGCYLGSWAAVVATVAAVMLASIPYWKIEECYVTGPLAYMARVSALGKNLFPLNGLAQKLRGELTWPQTINYILTRDMTSLVTWVGLSLGATAVLAALRRSRELNEAERAAALVLTFGGFFLGYVYKGGGRPFIGCTPTAILVGAYGLRLLKEEHLAIPGRSRVLAGGVALLLVYGAILLFFRPFSPPPASAWLHLPAGDLLFPSRQDADDLSAAVALVQKDVPPNGRIFVYKRSRSAMSGNYVAFYFLAQRGAATRYHELFEGTYTQPAAEDRLITELSDPALTHILETDPDPAPDDGPDEAHRISEFVRARFVQKARFGRFRVLRRTESPTPARRSF
jgi:hypothetical protein